MAVPTWGMYNSPIKPSGGKGYDPDPYDQSEDVRRGPDLTVNVDGIRYDDDPYDQVGQPNRPGPEYVNTFDIPYLPNIINPPTGSTSTPTGGGGLMDIISGLLGGAGNLAGSLGPLGSMLASYYASQRAADEMKEQAGRYGALGREAASMASPVSNARRGEWDARLSQLYDDPQAFLEGNPEYKAALKTGSAGIDRMNAISRSGMSGKGVADIMSFASDLGAKYIGKERDDLMNMAGYQFNPANAGSLLMEGGRLEGDALQAALAARLYPLGELSRMMNGGGGPGGGGPGGSPTSGGNPLSRILNMLKPGSSTNVQDMLRMFGPQGAPGLQDIFGLGNVAGSPEGDWSLGGAFRPGWADDFFNGQSPLDGYTNWDWSNPALSGYNPEGIWGEGAEAISNYFDQNWWTNIFGT